MLNQRIPFFLLIFFLFIGCSQRDWIAKVYMIKAENNISKAAQLKSQKVPYEARLKYFRKACNYFDRSYANDPTIFTFNRIEEAVDACWKSEQKDLEEKFKEFEAKYVKAHPQEYEYGESGVSMDLGGS